MVDPKRSEASRRAWATRKRMQAVRAALTDPDAPPLPSPPPGTARGDYTVTEILARIRGQAG